MEDLKDDTEYTIIALCKHKFKNGFKYVLKIKEKEHSEDNIQLIYKSSYYMEQCLNTVALEKYMEMPFIHFTTGKVRATPQKHKSKFIFLGVEDKYKIDPADEADAAASSSTT